MLTRTELPRGRGATWMLIASLAAGHYLATIALLTIAFAAGMSRFDSGEPAAGLFERTAETGHRILSAPLARAVAESRQSACWGPIAGQLVFVLNSLFWAVTIGAFVRGCQRYRSRRPALRQ